jgi:hypothetical protein
MKKQIMLFELISAIRSGDYYMFEYESDEEEMEEKEDEATVAEEQVCSFKRNI